MICGGIISVLGDIISALGLYHDLSRGITGGSTRYIDCVETTQCSDDKPPIH